MVTLAGNGFVLRKLLFSDASSIQQHINDLDVVKYTLNIPHPYTIKNGEEFAKRGNEEWETKSFIFGIIINNSLAGICSLTNLSKENRSAELGYWLGKEHWRKGIMTKAARLVVAFGFEECDFHRIFVGHFAENTGSKRVIEKLGFVKEGVEREKIFRFDRWHDHLIYSLLESEFKNFSNRIIL